MWPIFVSENCCCLYTVNLTYVGNEEVVEKEKRNEPEIGQTSVIA